MCNYSQWRVLHWILAVITVCNDSLAEMCYLLDRRSCKWLSWHWLSDTDNNRDNIRDPLRSYQCHCCAGRCNEKDLCGNYTEIINEQGNHAVQGVIAYEGYSACTRSYVHMVLACCLSYLSFVLARCTLGQFTPWCFWSTHGSSCVQSALSNINHASM